MSSPTQAASSRIAGNNEKTDDVGDDRSSSASVVAASSESTVNSQKKGLVRNIEIDYSNHGTDSGFLSGPLSSNLEEQQKEKDSSVGRVDANSKGNTEVLHRYEKSEAEVCVVDSGCIEEEEFGESHDPEVQDERQSISQQRTKSRQQQNKTLDSTLINTNMKLKHDVDAHISERFCNLILQNEPINNLNSTSRVATVEPIATTTPTKTVESNQLPAWEQCYQQNDEGDT